MPHAARCVQKQKQKACVWAAVHQVCRKGKNLTPSELQGYGERIMQEMTRRLDVVTVIPSQVCVLGGSS